MQQNGKPEMDIGLSEIRPFRRMPIAGPGVRPDGRFSGSVVCAFV
jgi:hypothetical protein